MDDDSFVMGTNTGTLELYKVKGKVINYKNL